MPGLQKGFYYEVAFAADGDNRNDRYHQAT